ncbi:MAG: hypothetical protein ACXWQR_09010 [Ktedonobacterales bacterium]
MPYLLQLRADTSLSAIQTALGRVRPRDIALIFPSGMPVALASDADLTALHSLQRFCEALDKEVVIIGGDEALRAAAVASGFAAATSLDAWKGASGSRIPRPSSTTVDEDDEWPTPLSLVDVDAEPEADFDVLPEYVQQLLGDNQDFRGSDDQDDALEGRVARNTHPLDDDEDDTAAFVSESYEDGMTSTIRGTSGIEDWHDVLGSASGEGESSDSSTM